MKSEEFRRLIPGDVIAMENQPGDYMVQGRTKEGGVIAVRTVVAYQPKGFRLVGQSIPVAPGLARDPWAYQSNWLDKDEGEDE